MHSFDLHFNWNSIGRKAIILKESRGQTNLVLGDAAGEPLQPQVSGTNAPAAKTHGHTIGPEVSKINTQSVKCIGIKHKSRKAHARKLSCAHARTDVHINLLHEYTLARAHTAEPATH
jgi:hypothetical protein